MNIFQKLKYQVYSEDLECYITSLFLNFNILLLQYNIEEDEDNYYSFYNFYGNINQEHLNPLSIIQFETL